MNSSCGGSFVEKMKLIRKKTNKWVLFNVFTEERIMLFYKNIKNIIRNIFH